MPATPCIPVAKKLTFAIGLIFWFLAALPLHAQQHGLFSYRILNQDSSPGIEITGYPANAAGLVDIPETINGLPVTSIGDAAFQDCASLTVITVPSGVKVLGTSAFRRCTSLTSLLLPPGLERIGDYAIYVCPNLTSIVIPETVSSIGLWAFANCSKLTSLTIPSAVTSIGAFAFSDCVQLADINIPGNITLIADGMFSGCIRLNNVVLPSAVTSIGGAAFASCRQFSYIQLPATVATIGGGAFSSCTGLTSLSIPPKVTTIGSGAFRNCSGLTGIVIPSGLARIETLTFAGCTGISHISIPASVTRILNDAFRDCTGLVSILIHSEELVIRETAFRGCPKLSSAVFTGHGSSVGFESAAFTGSAPSFSLYYLKGKSGFTSPTWAGLPSTMINEELHPAGTWLLGHGFPHDASLDQDPDGDGVNLLMEYALNLNPRLPSTVHLPQAVLQATTLSLEFHASSPGIIYRAETSPDLIHWATEGVIISPAGPDGKATASVLRNDSRRYLRLVITP